MDPIIEQLKGKLIVSCQASVSYTHLDVYKRQPHTRSYAFRVNRKEVKLAMRSALSAKLADEQLTVCLLYTSRCV